MNNKNKHKETEFIKKCFKINTYFDWEKTVQKQILHCVELRPQSLWGEINYKSSRSNITDEGQKATVWWNILCLILVAISLTKVAVKSITLPIVAVETSQFLNSCHSYNVTMLTLDLPNSWYDNESPWQFGCDGNKLLDVHRLDNGCWEADRPLMIRCHDIFVQTQYHIITPMKQNKCVGISVSSSLKVDLAYLFFL